MLSYFKHIIVGNYNKLLVKGSFTQNFAIIFSGAVVGLIIQLVSAPITSRIYHPEAYGLFSIINAIVTNLYVIGTLMYTQAFLLPKSRDKFYSLLQFTLVFSAVFSILITFVTVLLEDYIADTFGLQDLGTWLIVIGPAVFTYCVVQILNQWSVRIKAYKSYTTAKVLTNLGTRVFSIVAGILSGGAFYGLFTGEIFGKLINSVLLLWKKKKSSFRYLLNLDVKKSVETAKEYINYPKFVLPAEYINVLSTQMPIYILPIYYGSQVIGYYAFAVSLLRISIQLLGQSLKPIYFQRLTELISKDMESLKVITYNLYHKVLYLSLPPLLLLILYGEEIFGLFFSSQWEMAGTFAGIMGMYYLLQLVAFPFTSIFYVLGKERELLFLQLFILVGKLISLYIAGFLWSDNPTYAIFIFSIGNTITYCCFLYYIFFLIKGKKFSMKDLFVFLEALIVVVVLFFVIAIKNEFLQ